MAKTPTTKAAAKKPAASKRVTETVEGNGKHALLYGEIPNTGWLSGYCLTYCRGCKIVLISGEKTVTDTV